MVTLLRSSTDSLQELRPTKMDSGNRVESAVRIGRELTIASFNTLWQC